MPYTSLYLDDGRGLHKKGSGIVTGLEVISNCVEETIDEERARKVRYALIDLTEVTEMKVTPPDIRVIVDVNRKMASFTPGVPIALVAPGQLSYAMARLWHTLTDDFGWTSNVFHSRPEAVAWLRKELLSKDDSDPELGLYPSLKTQLP